MGRWSGDVALLGRSRGFCLAGRRFGIPIVLVLELRVILCVANHRRSLHRSRPPCNLANLTLYEPSLLAALGKFPVKPLKALLLERPVRERGSRGFRAKHPQAHARTRFPPCLLPTPATDAPDLAAWGAPASRVALRVPRPKPKPAYRGCQSADALILPVSMPETVVGLRPASRANLACVHIRSRRTFSTRSPMSVTLAPRL